MYVIQSEAEIQFLGINAPSYEWRARRAITSLVWSSPTRIIQVNFSTICSFRDMSDPPPSLLELYPHGHPPYCIGLRWVLHDGMTSLRNMGIVPGTSFVRSGILG